MNRPPHPVRVFRRLEVHVEVRNFTGLSPYDTSFGTKLTEHLGIIDLKPYDLRLRVLSGASITKELSLAEALAHAHHVVATELAVLPGFADADGIEITVEGVR
jgi:hypothetical protein